MFNILEFLYYDEPLSMRVSCNLENPKTSEEHRIVNQLRTVDKKTAQALKRNIRILVNQQAKRAFYNGTHFGAQLMLQLMEETEKLS